MELHDKYSEATTIGLKILGAVLAIVSFRWIAKIFAGEDGKFNTTEFGKFIGFWFFIWAAVYIIWKEGNRPSEYHLFSEWHLCIVFGGLLSVLQLEAALDRIVVLIKAVIDLKTKKAPSNEQQ